MREDSCTEGGEDGGRGDDETDGLVELAAAAARRVLGHC